jgi:hypothetical protein
MIKLKYNFVISFKNKFLEKKHFPAIFLLINIIFMFSIGCSMTPPVQNQDSGSLLVSLVASDKNLSISSYDIILNNRNTDDTRSINVINSNTTLNELSKGEWEIQATAKNSNNESVASGKNTAKINSNQVSVCEITVKAKPIFIFKPGYPIGIPEPNFGINETVESIYGSDDYYTYYVDNTDPKATNTNNTYGTKSLPRKSIPNSPLAGSVVEIHGGPYTSAAIFSNSGTVTSPIFIRGKAASRPTIQQSFSIQASFIIIENIIFDQNQEVRLSLSISANDAAHPVHHVAVRNCEMRNYCNSSSCSGGHNSVMAVGDYNDTGNYPNNIIFYKNYIHDNGYSSSTVDRDIHAIQVGKSEFVWILNNEMYNNAGDSVQVITEVSYLSTAAPINHVYIGRNVMHGEHENAVDLKRCTDVVISENIMYDFQGISAGNSGAACAIVVHMGGSIPLTPKNILIINNEIFDVKDSAIISEGDSNEVYFVGNIVHDIGLTSTSTVMAAFTLWATGSHYIYNNLFYNVLSGIRCTGGNATSEAGGYSTSSTTDIKNNIFANMHHSPYYHFYMGGSNSDPRPHNTLFDHNLFYQQNGNLSISWYSDFNNLTNFYNEIGQGTGCLDIADSEQLFVDPGNNNFHLNKNSSAINFGIDVTTKLENAFGIIYNKDYDGNLRSVNAMDIGPYEYQ